MYSNSSHTTFKICSCGFQSNIPIFQGYALFLLAVAHWKYPSGFPKYIFQIQWYFPFAKVLHSELALPKNPLKRYVRRKIMDVMQPEISLHFPRTCDIRFFRTKLFLSSRRPFLPDFTTKSYLRSETYIIRKSIHCAARKSMFWGEFCLCVEKVMRVFHPFFFISSDCVGRLFAYMVSVVMLGQTLFALKCHFELIRR